MSSIKKLLFFMHFHNSCTCNSDYFIFLIKTGNNHKERMLSQTIINTFKKYKGGGKKE